MNVLRKLLLWGSQNQWLKNHLPTYRFVQKAVRRFMPGENLSDALQASQRFAENNIPTVLTYLGENVTDLSEAEQTTQRYLHVLDKISAQKLEAEISIKLTQLGLDISTEQTHRNFKNIAAKAAQSNKFVWIDMESSSYVDITIDFYKQQRKEFDNIGICLQSYLYRTNSDLLDLLKLNPSIRLVKGAYNEPSEIAFKDKYKVDQNYLDLAILLLKEANKNVARTAFATHDLSLISEIEKQAENLNWARNRIEFHMLYGIKTSEQFRLANDSYRIQVLISYGNAWFPWYMRRLAERPANVGFVLKNIFTR